jgi:hypothetical protein
MEDKEEVKLNLKEKLNEIKKEVSILQKNSEGHGYTFVDEESILLKVNTKMDELRVRLIPNFVPQTTNVFPVTYENAKGQNKTDIVVHSEMTFTWEDLDSNEKEVNYWYMVGQQADGSQAMGSGLTYTNRYFLLKYFNSATTKDDPDAIRSAMEKEEEQKKLSATQTKVKKIFDKMLKKYQTQEKIYEILGTNKDDFVKNYSDNEKCKTLLEQMELIEKESEKKKKDA